MFNENNVICVDNVLDWQEAIALSGKPLLQKKFIEKSYIDKSIENIKEFGFYIVLDEYIAMPHSRAENGVNKTSISFLKINNGVMFGENIIYLVFMIAATDSNSHIDLIKDLLELFQNSEKKEKLIKAKTKKEILNILGGNL